MMRKINVFIGLICVIVLACSPREIAIVSGMTFNSQYEADHTYHAKSKTTVYYDQIHTRTLTFKSGDTLIVEDDGKVTSVMYRLDFYNWYGKQKLANAIYDGVDSAFKRRTIRITLNEFEKEKFALVTSEVMNGDYDPVADSVWTYYKYRDPNK